MGASGHYVCEDCDGCHATNQYLLQCLNHVLQKCGEEKMEQEEWMDLTVSAKMQVFLYVHKIREEMLKKTKKEEVRKRRSKKMIWKRTSTISSNSFSENYPCANLHIWL